jgi:threonine dehydratase
MEIIPDLNSIREAAKRIKPFIHKTPVLTCKTFNDMFEGEIYFKCENFQKIGAFKIRGATNAVFSLSEEEIKKGVATHSSGNHAQALALAAKNRGIAAHVVMPENSKKVKIEAVKNYGANIIFCKATLKDREKALNKVITDTGAIFIHPYNNMKVIEGQSTAALEFLEEVEKLDIIMAPVGGGGLLSGTALSTVYLSPSTIVTGTEPDLADDSFRSFRDSVIYPPNPPLSVADGLLTSLGENTFHIIKKYVHNIVTVSEESIISSMKLLWERMKIIVEPSSSVPFAALMEKKVDIKGKKVGIILSGGNVDLNHLPWNCRNA